MNFKEFFTFQKKPSLDEVRISELKLQIVNLTSERARLVDGLKFYARLQVPIGRLKGLGLTAQKTLTDLGIDWRT